MYYGVNNPDPIRQSGYKKEKKQTYGMNLPGIEQSYGEYIEDHELLRSKDLSKDDRLEILKKYTPGL